VLLNFKNSSQAAQTAWNF